MRRLNLNWLVIRDDLGELLNSLIKRSLFIVVIYEFYGIYSLEVASSEDALVNTAWPRRHLLLIHLRCVSLIADGALGRLYRRGLPVVLTLIGKCNILTDKRRGPYTPSST